MMYSQYLNTVIKGSETLSHHKHQPQLCSMKLTQCYNLTLDFSKPPEDFFFFFTSPEAVMYLRKVQNNNKMKRFPLSKQNTSLS